MIDIDTTIKNIWKKQFLHKNENENENEKRKTNENRERRDEGS
jgi:hypothetical protein